MPDFGNMLLAAAGISFLIFIHELGHYLAARAFDVRVEVFSIGFGPRLWGVRRGETDYRLSLVPLGGYVKMAGEYADLEDDSTPLHPRDLAAKPAWQRAIVFAGGVLMNFAFAFVIFPVVFALGVPFIAPIVGEVDAGGPAWAAGLRPGDEILAVNGSRIYDFTDIATEITLGDPEHSTLELRRDGKVRGVRLLPERNEDRGLYEIGVYPSNDGTFSVTQGGAAEAAGLLDGDRLLRLNGERPESPLALSDVAAASGAPLHVEVERPGPDGAETLAVVVKPLEVPTDPEGQTRRLGVLPASTRVVARRGAADGPEAPLAVGDSVLDLDGRPIWSQYDLLLAARTADAASPAEPPRLLHVERGDEVLALPLSAAVRRWLLDEDLAFGPRDTFIRILPGGALQAAGLADGDEILALDEQPLREYGDLVKIVATSHAERWSVRYRRGAEVRVVVVPTLPASTWDAGFTLAIRERMHREDLPGAFRAGFDRSLDSLRTTWLTLAKLLTGDVGSQNLGGIVSISVITYHFADGGWGKLLFFLGLLSINLGFINILPIPVLDGGQMLLLLFEKVKGSRLSARFLQGAQLAGLVAVLGLVLYVTYRDIVRFF